MLTTFQEDQCPVIADEIDPLNPEYPSSDWGYCRGPDTDPALLFMSGYGKTPYACVDGYTTCGALPIDSAYSYEATRPSQAYGQEDYPAQPATLYNQETGRLALLPAMHHDAQASYNSQTDDPQAISWEPPVITEWRPNRGSQGTALYIFIKSKNDLKHSSYPRIFLMFAARQCTAILTRVESYSTSYDYVLTADVPSPSSTGWRSSEVPVRLHFQDHSGSSVGTMDVGFFNYTGQSVLCREDSFSESTLSSAASKLVLRQLPPAASYAPSSRSGIPRSPNHCAVSRSLPRHTSTPRFSPYEGARESFSRRSSNVSGSSVGSYLPHTPAASRFSSDRSVISTSRGTSISAGGASIINTPFIGITTIANPMLYRKYCLTKPDSKSPYKDWPRGPMVTLYIYGELDSMKRNWTPAEQKCKRRLVQFWRTQNGSSVSIGFQPVEAEQKSPNTFCFSCIRWRDNECYYSSVDIINLLSLIAGMKFDTEEQNRVRRNVENMEPTTVGREKEDSEKTLKEKEDSEEFFKLVMSFTNPKPRNIAKNLKFFPWKSLGPSLTKVMGKYCAIYPPTTDKASLSRLQSMDIQSMKLDPEDTKDGAMAYPVYAPTSQPTYLSPNIHNVKADPDAELSPLSTSRSIISSPYSSSGGGPSSTTSPNISYGVPASSASVSQQQIPYGYAYSDAASAPSKFSYQHKYSTSSGIQYPYATATTTAGASEGMLSPRSVPGSRRGGISY